MAASTEQVLAAAQQRGPRSVRIYATTASSALRAYKETVLPALVELVITWWRGFDSADKAAWLVSASTDAGICIEAPDDDAQDTICCPHNLGDATLLIGWQRYRNQSIRDPKCEIAERMIAVLLSSDALAEYVEIEDMEDVAEEFGLYQRTLGYVSESEEERTREAREDAEEAAAAAKLAATNGSGDDDDDSNANGIASSTASRSGNSSNSSDNDDGA